MNNLVIDFLNGVPGSRDRLAVYLLKIGKRLAQGNSDLESIANESVVEVLDWAQKNLYNHRIDKLYIDWIRKRFLKYYKERVMRVMPQVAQSPWPLLWLQMDLLSVCDEWKEEYIAKLYFIEGWSMKDVGIKVGLSTDTVWKIVGKLRERMRDLR